VPCRWGETPLAREVTATLAREGLDALVDPFGPGIQVGTRIDEVLFESLLFVATPQSVSSPWCRRELDAATRARVPIFCLRTANIALPEELSERIAIDADDPPSAVQAERLGLLAISIRQRAAVWGALRVISRMDSPHEQRLASEWLELDADAGAISEQLEQLKAAWPTVIDEAARLSLVRAVERVRSPQAADLLRRWRSQLDRDTRTESSALLVSAIEGALQRSLEAGTWDD
jgi:hypothetical protein